MVKVNGTELNIAGKTVAEYLAETNYDPKRIAVERNGDIVPKAQYETAVLADGDSVEVVSFGLWQTGMGKSSRKGQSMRPWPSAAWEA